MFSFFNALPAQRSSSTPTRERGEFDHQQEGWKGEGDEGHFDNLCNYFSQLSHPIQPVSFI